MLKSNIDEVEHNLFVIGPSINHKIIVRNQLGLSLLATRIEVRPRESEVEVCRSAFIFRPSDARVHVQGQGYASRVGNRASGGQPHHTAHGQMVLPGILHS